ncbi:MAG TPA: thiamine pyrophosphate-requiring protein [Candidatus Eisenbacteria bacterium]|nr:thiamine pyrophosphate-requiring protein [Candidatus Eisenbacteria bacterium]
MFEGQPIAFDPRWKEYEAQDWSDALVTAMKLGGVDHLFFVSGTEIGFYQESIAKAQLKAWPAPRLITVPHEGVALNAALGSSMVSGQPSATAVHVDVGTLNYGAGLHSAWRGGYPVLITAGTGPRGYPGTMRGARNRPVQWVQEPRDQNEILRQYTKLDHRLEHQDNPGLIVSRLLQVAMSEPKGPVYLAVPRETAMLKIPNKIRFPTRDELGLARPAWPDPRDARRIAEWLIKAENPCVYTSKSGRNPEAVRELVALAELLSLPVNDSDRVDRLNFPTTHPLYDTGPEPKDADVLLVIENPVPFMPPFEAPTANAKIAWIDVDPVQSRYKTMEYHADLWLPVPAATALRAIHDAATSMLGQTDRRRIAERKARLEQRKREMLAESEKLALEAGRRRPMHPRWVAHQVGKILEPETILLDEALSNSGLVQEYHRRALPGTYFGGGGSSGGWGSGAAFGAKLAAPGRDVVLVTGDGFFMFGTPLPALWSAAHYKAPFLTVVFTNRSYSTGTTGVLRSYPDGAVAQTENFEGGLLDPAPDFGKLAEAVNGYGETVRDPERLAPALQRGLECVRQGAPAIISAHLPTTIEEMRLRQRHGRTAL